MKREKILIIEHDDFLREILGNILHKRGYYILSDFCVRKGLILAKRKKIDKVILGTSCKEYEGKSTIHYIQKQLGDVDFFIINNNKEDINFIDKEKQIKTSALSIYKILKAIN